MSISTFDVQTMLAAYDGTPRPKTFLRQILFAGRTKTFTTEEVMIDIRKGKRRLAPFVAPNVNGKVVESEGYRTDRYRTPIIRPRDVITVDRLQERMAGESIVSGKSPADRLADEQARIATSFDNDITRREEWMVAQLIFTGSIVMAGEGVNETYSVNFTNVEDLSGGDLWSATTATPLDDLSGWQLEVMQDSGITPNVCIMASDVLNAFLAHSTVQAELDKKWMQLGEIVPREVPNGARYIGHLNRLNLDIYEYVDWYVDDTTGALMPFVPAGRLALIPSADRIPDAKMLYGAWTEIKTRTTYEGERIPRTWVDEGANAENMEVVSRPLPMIPDSDCWYVGIVL